MGKKTRHPISPERRTIIAERIEKLANERRERGNYSNWAGVAAEFGVAEGELSKLRRGTKFLTIGALIMVCERMNVSPGWLLGFDKE